MEESESLLVTERDSFQERGKGFHGEEGDATSFASFRGSTSSRKKGSTLSSSTSSHVETLSCITPQRLKEIAIELGIIKLCWPQNNNLHQERKYYPASFSENTNKEKLLMWYAENFRQQFHHEFPHRRPLLLAVENECGLQKMVCTTVRPTSMRYPELQHWQGCADFIADHIIYSPISHPTRLPAVVVSPWTVLERQAGHSFEMATLLASLLIGADYDAYVVSGYATREVCNNDQLRVVCPDLIPKLEVVEEPRPTTPPKYQVREPPYLHSRFMEQMAEREKQQEEDKRRKLQEEEDRRIAELERPAPDELWGFRLHAWVLIRPRPGRDGRVGGGSRDGDDAAEGEGLGEDESATPFFVEPSTGFRHEIGHPGYHRVESVWNHLNYWVNVQPEGDGDTCEGTDFDLADVRKWEHFLAGEPAEWRKGPDPQQSRMDLDDEQEQLDEEVQAEKHLDMPASWVPRLDVQHAVYERRYPGSSKTILYKKAKVEKLAPYLAKDGLMKRVTVYEDYEHCTPLRLTEHYENRADFLYQVKKELRDGSATDLFRRGRDDACKEHQYKVAESSLDSPRKLWFYDVARNDGLEHLEMTAEHLTELFRCRGDRLYYRRVHFQGPDDEELSVGSRRTIRKITEKFERNPEVDANRDIAVRVFLLNENKVFLKFHYGPGKVTAATREFVKPVRADRGRGANFDPDLVTCYEAGGKPMKQVEVLMLLEEQLDAEDKTLCHVRQIQDELSSFLRMRMVETAMPRLQVSLFDEERNEKAKKGLREREQRLLEEEAREVEADVDFLAPYMARLGYPDSLSPAQALAMRDQCLSDFKQQYVNRAQNMQNRFETEKERLQELNKWYEENQEKLTPEEEDNTLEESKKLDFLLQTLQIRLNRHREMASQRYLAIEACLRADPRLAVLY